MKTLRAMLGMMWVMGICMSPAEESPKKGGGVKPLFKNSIVSTELDFITCEDSSAFKALRFLGRKSREMPDQRNDVLMDEDTFLFEASFCDRSKVEIWAHSSFGSVEKAQHYAQMLSAPLGKLPSVMRGKLAHVVVHRGDATAFGEAEGHFFVLYSENMDTRIRNHDLEETVFHEAVHATLEKTYRKHREWLAAQAADAGFITKYAADHPSLEDLPESALFAYTMLKNPGRLPAEVESWVEKQMPHRLAFFRGVFSASTGDEKRSGAETSR